jgi:hypothetical protein
MIMSFSLIYSQFSSLLSSFTSNTLRPLLYLHFSASSFSFIFSESFFAYPLLLPLFPSSSLLLHSPPPSFLPFHPSHIPLLLSFIRYVVDAADQEKFETTKKELHDLISKAPLARIPLLVVGNKNDLPEAVSQDQLIQIL